jgi:hypothetical protein
MTEEQEPKVTPEPVPEPQEEPSINAQAKKLPWVQELMSKAKEADELKAAQEAERKDAELKKAEEEGRYQDIIKAKDAEFEAFKAQSKRQLLEVNLTSEMIKVGFGNDLFINGAIQSYDADTHGDVSAYAASLASDEGNKHFLNSAGGRTVQPAPGAVPSGGGNDNWDQVRADLEGPDRDKRIAARAKLTAYREKNGEYPF